MKTIVEVNHLSKQFKEISAVSDLSFTVNEGDVYGFLGENGAGKSTTIRMLLTLVKPDKGDISIFGKNLNGHHNEILREIGAIIERPDLYKYLSAYDNLSIFARLSGIKVSRKMVMDLLHMVGLEKRAGSIKTFSQGMKQRLGIAVTIVHDPRLIILDEPTNGLDPQGIADMRKLIVRLSRDRGKTVIISSHLLHEIEQVANRMLIIHKGNRIAEGTVSVLMDPSDSVVQIVTTDNTGAMEKLMHSEWVNGLEISGNFIRLRTDRTSIPALVAHMNASNIGVLSIQPRHSLEDYFLTLTNAENHVEPLAN